MQAWASTLDGAAHQAMARLGGGLSPISLALAAQDWAMHLAAAPGTQWQLALKAWQAVGRWAEQWPLGLWPVGLAGAATPVPDHALSAALRADPRYQDDAWQVDPWRSLALAHLLAGQWWQDATHLRGMAPHHREQVGFHARQWLDMMSPANGLATHPQVLRRAVQTHGLSLWAGGTRLSQDLLRDWLPSTGEGQGLPAPGQGLAMTPGRVVMRNHLVELIQYEPRTPRVQREPVLIVPSCIMKYYILDLSDRQSMAQWLMRQGHTVFILSWRNPDEHDAAIGFDDYVRHGVLDSLDHVRARTGAPVHLVGYCLGGTFAAIAAAALARDTEQGADAPLASLTLLAAETDFTEPGEMGVLIDEAQVESLEDLMAVQGYLSGRQMAGSFQFLHSRDLVWSQRSRRWLLGEDELPNELMIWNADLTRLPATMHSEYLRRMFLRNELATGRYCFEGEPVSLQAIACPVFGVGTVKDHVCPWKSVYKLHQLVRGEVRFVLTNGGHNAGIVSEPGHPGRHFQMHVQAAGAAPLTPVQWQAAAARHEGSWWPAWHDWLSAQGTQGLVSARVPPVDDELGAAPGRYVHVRYAD